MLLQIAGGLCRVELEAHNDNCMHDMHTGQAPREDGIKLRAVREPWFKSQWTPKGIRCGIATFVSTYRLSVLRLKLYGYPAPLNKWTTNKTYLENTSQEVGYGK